MPDDSLTRLLNDEAGPADLEHAPDAADAADVADATAIAMLPLTRERALRGVPSAAESAATTVLDTSEDELDLPLKRMRSWSPARSAVKSARAEIIDLSAS